MLSVALARFNKKLGIDVQIVAIDSEPVRNRIGLDVDTLVMPYENTIVDLAMERLTQKMAVGGGFDSIGVPPILVCADKELPCAKQDTGA